MDDYGRRQHRRINRVIRRVHALPSRKHDHERYNRPTDDDSDTYIDDI